MDHESHLLKAVFDLGPDAKRLPGASSVFSSLPRGLVVFRRGYSLLSDPPSMEPRFTLAIALRGRTGVIVDGKLFVLGPDEGVLIFPYQSHYYSRSGPREAFWLFLVFDMADQSALAPLRDGPFTLDERGLELVDHLQRSWRRLREPDGGGRAGESVHWLSLLLCQLLRAGDRPPPTARPVERDGETLKTIRRVVAFVSRNRNRPIGVRDVANAVAFSESHLRLLFRRTIGVSLGSYMRRVRIRRACQLLRERGLNVAQAADACGFSSPYAFSRTFRRVMGQTPSAYRRS